MGRGSTHIEGPKSVANPFFGTEGASTQVAARCEQGEPSSHVAAGRRNRRRADHWTACRSESHSQFAVVNQGPVCGTLIAQPVMLHLACLLPRSHERWNRGLP